MQIKFIIINSFVKKQNIEKRKLYKILIKLI